MIKFNYKIERDEKNETKTYTPNIPNKLKDLVCIEGPNSIGKSTFLNILALGLYGRKNKRINPSLKRKLEDLMNADHQLLTFSFEIFNKKDNLKIVAEKRDLNKRQIDLYEIKGGKQKSLSFENFEKKYNLIYDIPENPSERLKELANELKDRQNYLSNKINRLKLHLREILEEINLARNPEKIKKFKKDVEKLRSENNIQKKCEKIQEEELDLIKKFFHITFFLANSDELQRIETKIKNLKKKLREQTRKNKKQQTEGQKFLKDRKAHISQVDAFLDEVINKLRNAQIQTKENYIDFLEDKHIEEFLDDADRRITFFKGIEAFNNEVTKLFNETESNENLAESNLLAQLIEVLEEYTDTHIIIPGTNKTVTDFINVLREKASEHEQLIVKYNFYRTLLKQIDNLNATSKRYVEYYLPKYNKLPKNLISLEPDSSLDLKGQLEKLERRRKAYKDKCEYHKKGFIKLDIKESEAKEDLDSIKRETYVRPYIFYNEDELEDTIESKSNDIDNLNGSIKEYEHTLSRRAAELERLESKKSHTYQNYKSTLKTLFDVSQRLEHRLANEFDANIRMLTEGIKIDRKLTEQQRKYFDSVAIHLARRLQTLFHGDKTYEIEKINLLERKIHTKSGKEILLTDMGTGQSQSAYLKGILGTTDKRKIIALIDEVAMMDSSSMRQIFDRLIEQYKKGQLLAGIIIQKGEKIKVTNIN